MLIPRSPEETQQRTRKILVSLFPPFILKLFPIMFSSPFPAFSAKLNALITSSTCKWLMGPQSLFDLDQVTISTLHDVRADMVIFRGKVSLLTRFDARLRWRKVGATAKGRVSSSRGAGTYVHRNHHALGPWALNRL